MTALRLLYLGPYNSPHLEDLAVAMHDRGHSVTAAGSRWGGGLPEDPLAEHGIRAVQFRFPATLALRSLIHELQPDVVHAHWMPFATLAALAGARPLAVSAWGSDVYDGGFRRRLSIRLALRRASLATADSADLVGRLQKLGPRSLRTMVVNWGVDLDAVRPPTFEQRNELKARFGLEPGPVVLSPRGLKDVYNPELVLEAFRRVRASVPEAQLVVKHLGDGSVAEEPGVHAVGRLGDREMIDLFRAADVTVSVPRSDSSPRSVWEAMAAGSAVIVSDLPWVHELIRDGREAVVIAAQPSAVADAIAHMLTDLAQRERIVSAARRLVETHRNREVELGRLELCYRELASSR